MIELEAITKVYRNDELEVVALDGVSLTIEAGEFIAIMGPSGSGKSTLMHILGMLDRPENGSYLLLGRDVSLLADDELAKLRNQLAGFVFQQFHLLRRMNAAENVRLPSIYRGDSQGGGPDALERLAAVGLQDRAAHRPSELSGGQQQRVAIARALINDPAILFADEPTGNLDSKSGSDIMAVLKALNAQGRTIVMVTHEPEIAAYAERVITMRDGRIVSDERRAAARPAARGHRVIGEVLATRRSSLNRAELAGYFRQAMNTILSNRVRSFLSMLGILVGVAAVIAMLALGAGAKESIAERLKSLGSNLLNVQGGSSRLHGVAGGVGSVTRFTPQDIEAIEALAPIVRRASGTVRGTAQVVFQNENWSTSVEGVGMEYGEIRATVPEVGRWFTEGEIAQRAKVAIIGTTILEKLFHNEDPIGQVIKVNRINFTVIGVLPEKGFMGPRDQDDVILVPVTTAMFRLLGKDYLDQIFVEVASADSVALAQEQITELIQKRHRLYQDDADSFHIRNMSEIQEMLSGTMRTMSMLLGIIATISLLVGGIGIMNIMLVSVTERTREIGLRKAVGARRIDILAQFLIEAIVMTVSGGAIGVLVGSVVAIGLSLFAGWTVKVTLASIALSTLFSVAVGLFFGMWPARKASELDPVEALRYE